MIHQLFVTAVKFLAQLLAQPKLSVVGKDEVISESGWRLRILGNSPGTWRVEYIEGEKVVTVLIEPAAGIWYVNLADSSWSTISGRIEMTQTDKRRIGTNIRQAMRALKFTCKIQQ